MSSQANIQGVFNERVEHLNKFRRVMTDALLEHHLISQEAEILFLAKSFDQYEDISSVSLFYYLAENNILSIPDSDGSRIAIGTYSSPEAAAIISNDKDFLRRELVGEATPLTFDDADTSSSETVDVEVQRPLAIDFFYQRYVVKPYKKTVLFDKAPNMAYIQKLFTGRLVENIENYPYFVQLTTTGMPRRLSFGDRLLLGENTYEVRLVQPVSRLNDSVQRVMVSPVNFTDVPVKDTVDPPIETPILENYKKLKTL